MWLITSLRLCLEGASFKGGGAALNCRLLASGAQGHSESTPIATPSAYATGDLLSHRESKCVIVPENMRKLNLYIFTKDQRKGCQPRLEREGWQLCASLRSRINHMTPGELEDFEEVEFAMKERETSLLTLSTMSHATGSGELGSCTWGARQPRSQRRWSQPTLQVWLRRRRRLQVRR